MKRIVQIRQELEYMAEREAIKLWRIARRAHQHGCSDKLVEDIRKEGSWLYDTGRHAPDRLLYWTFEYEFKYAFKM